MEKNKIENYETAVAKIVNFEKKKVEIADQYKTLPFQDKINVLAKAFNATTGEITTSLCRGKYRGTSDIFVKFDNGVSLYIGNEITPKAKSKKVQNRYIDSALVEYNPETIEITKKNALVMLRKREVIDNKKAKEMGLKPYTLLNVEFNDGSDNKNSGYLGWYYVTLAIDGEIYTHLETGLHYDIATGKVTEFPSHEKYYVAGGLQESDVDYLFNNVGFSTEKKSYCLTIGNEILERAKATLEERNKNNQTPETEHTYEIYQVKCGPEQHNYRFASYEILTKLGLSIDSHNYDLVYTGTMDDETTLEDIYTKFNLYHPEGYTGHSLSVSDIVVLAYDGKEAAYYCDSIGFKEVPEFLLSQQTQLNPNDYLTGDRIQTPRGMFFLTTLNKKQMEAIGYGYHHSSEGGKYLIMGNGEQAFAIANEE